MLARNSVIRGPLKEKDFSKLILEVWRCYSNSQAWSADRTLPSWSARWSKQMLSSTSPNEPSSCPPWLHIALATYQQFRSSSDLRYLFPSVPCINLQPLMLEGPRGPFHQVSNHCSLTSSCLMSPSLVFKSFWLDFCQNLLFIIFVSWMIHRHSWNSKYFLDIHDWPSVHGWLQNQAWSCLQLLLLALLLIDIVVVYSRQRQSFWRCH